jgi:hypothetical protein
MRWSFDHAVTITVLEKPSIARLPFFRTNQAVKDAFGAAQSGFVLDNLICSEATVAVAIDGAKRSRQIQRIGWAPS